MAVLPATYSDSQPMLTGPHPSGKVVVSKIFVHGIQIDAEVGVYPHERGRTQPLVVDVELDVAWSGADRLADTVNYETIVAAAKAVADEGHIELVEVYAEHLAGRVMADPRVTRARIRVDKPQALAPHAAGAGVEITVVRA
ncbi:hypothetical protein AMEJIAPC_00389 [Caulobacter sp. NIBR1757]|nr:hypothetical protein AMEJIAPC_00389 [Caulobacter sp. NIBR1757]